jgi:hypothetical protein
MFVLCVKNRDLLRFNFPEISSLFKGLGMILAMNCFLIDRTNYIRVFTTLTLKKKLKIAKTFQVLEST